MDRLNLSALNELFRTKIKKKKTVARILKIIIKI